MPWKLTDSGSEPNVREMLGDVRRALRQAGHVIAEGFKEVPPKRPGEKHLAGPLPGGFYSVRQRRYVLGGIRAGTLQVPYIRTGNLPRSWSVSPVQGRGKSIYVDVYSDPGEAPYNIYVQSTEKQVPMHSDWPTPETVSKEHGDKAMAVVEKALGKWGFK